MAVNVNTKHSLIKDFSTLDGKFEEIKNMDLPSFVEFFENSDDSYSAVCERLTGYKNVLLIGNGGSVNGARAYYGSLFPNINFEFVRTMEPDYLNEISSRFRKENTLVLAVSKSGTTVGVLESLLFFMEKEYSIVVITSSNGTLHDIAKKNDWEIIDHPPVGGRFSAGTSCGLAPAYLMGLDTASLNKGLSSAYKRNNPKVAFHENPALNLASNMFLLEEKGFLEVFMPVYSYKLSSFLPIIVQLMHESFGKEEKGQSFFGDLAPESQHHTNQRFFGGRKNICGLFMRVLNQKDSQSKVNIPENLKDVPLKNHGLDSISGIPYEKALEFEYEGTYEDAVDKGIPVIDVSLDRIDEENIGEMMGFWQYVAVYSSILRSVNPYDQPMVESSKKISFSKRLQYKSH